MRVREGGIILADHDSSGKRPKRRPGRAAGKMAGKEIEVKLRLDDRADILKRLGRLRAELVNDRVHETNTLYDMADGSLAANGQLVRIRIEQPAGREKRGRQKKLRGETGRARALLTHKGPPEGSAAGGKADGNRYKIREEQESEIENPEEMAKVFKAMGLLPWFRYEKYRSTYRLPGISGVKVELDETSIGDFLELEGQPEAIRSRR